MGDLAVHSLFYSPCSQGQRRYSPWFLKEAILLEVITPHVFLAAEARHQAWGF